MNPRLAALLGLALAVSMSSGVQAVAAPNDHQRQGGVDVVYEPGVEVRLDHGMKKLRQTSKSFRAAVRHELMFLWDYTGRDPKCRRSPLITVHEYRASGFAYVDEGVYGPGDCAGGGNWQFFLRNRNGKWRTPTAVGGQEMPACSALARHSIPRMTGAEVCWDAAGTTLLNYFPTGLPTIDWNADVAQPGEKSCGTYYNGTNPQHVYASGVGCGAVGILTDWWSNAGEDVGWICEGFQNGLTACNQGDTATIPLSAVAPYLRAVRPGGLLVPTTRANHRSAQAERSPDFVVRRLVRTVNVGSRAGARTVAQRPVVRAMFKSRSQGYRFARPLGDCMYNSSTIGYDCSTALLKDGQVAGSAYFVVQGTGSDLLTVRVSLAFGE